MLRLTLILSAISLAAMVVIDRVLGERAEFLNAWSVMERLLGRSPSAGSSLVATRLGPLGEALVVIFVSLALGALLGLVIRLALKLLR